MPRPPRDFQWAFLYRNKAELLSLGRHPCGGGARFSRDGWRCEVFTPAAAAVIDRGADKLTPKAPNPFAAAASAPTEAQREAMPVRTRHPITEAELPIVNGDWQRFATSRDWMNRLIVHARCAGPVCAEGLDQPCEVRCVSYDWVHRRKTSCPRCAVRKGRLAKEAEELRLGVTG